MKKYVISGLAAILVIAFSVIWFGFYNVAANDKHYALTLELLELVRNRSISVRANDIVVPDLNNPKLITAGAISYSQMCTGCHLAPGMKPTELHQGLYPQPPNFSQSTHGLHSPANLFWVIKNGIKMTGMPAWSPPHTEQQIWEMVAFINQLDGMSEQQYQDLVKVSANETAAEHDDGHSH